MLFALAHMCGRLKVPTRLPDLWDQVAPCVDICIKNQWAAKETKGVSVIRPIWTEAHSDVVYTIIKQDAYDACEKAAGYKRQLPRHHLEEVLATVLGGWITAAAACAACAAIMSAIVGVLGTGICCCAPNRAPTR